MNRDTPREATIVRACIAALRRAGALVRKLHGGPTAVAGDPDLYGCYRGRAFALECKRPGCRPTPLQQARLAEWSRSGAITDVVTCASDAVAIVCGPGATAQEVEPDTEVRRGRA